MATNNHNTIHVNVQHNENLDLEYEIYPEKFCEICCLKLNSKCIKLHCTHCFHYDCLVYSLTNGGTEFNNMLCPYCRKKIDYIPLLENQTPIKNVHKEYEEYIQKENAKYQINTSVEITSGKYKSHQGIIKNVSEKMLTIALDSHAIVRIKKENIIII